MTDIYSQSTADIAQWLLDTTRVALSECNREPITTAYVAAGAVAWDDCCGSLIVAPERVFFAETFPIEDTTEVICDEGYLAVQFVVILLRCLPNMDSRGNPPSAASLTAAYNALMGDAAIVMNAVAGPLPSQDWERTRPAQSFVGAEGGCIGVETRITIGIPQTEWAICCTEPQPHVPGGPLCRPNAEQVVFEPCEGLTSTNVQDAICELATSSAAIGTPVSFTVNGGTIGGTQPTFSGPPLFTGQYIRIGDYVHFEIQVEFDNITNFGTGQYFVDLPFAPSHPVMIRGGCVHRVSNGRQYALAGHAITGNVRLTLWYTGSNGHDEEFDHNSPFNLTTADNFHIQGSYLAV